MKQPKNVDEWVARPHKEDIQRIPEALRLADILQHRIPSIKCLEDAAAELRRLHEAHEWQHKMAGQRLRRIEKLEAINQELIEALGYIEAQRHLGHIHYTASAALAKARGKATDYEYQQKARAALTKVRGEQSNG